MPAVVDGASAVQVDVVPVLRRQRRAVLRIDEVETLAEHIIALQRESPAVALFAGDLQTVIRGIQDRLDQADGAQRVEWLIRPSRVHVARGGAGCQNRIVLVHSQRQFVGQGPDICSLNTDGGGNLPLYREIHLVAVGGAEIEAHSRNGGGEDELRIRRRVVVRERRLATRQQRVGIGQRGRIVELLPDGEGLVVGRRINLVPGHAAGEHAKRGANRHLAIAERVPGESDPWRQVVPVSGNRAAADPRIAWEQQTGRRRRNHFRLRAGDVGQQAVANVGNRHLQVVPQSNIHREARMQANVILEEERVIPIVIDLGAGRILVHGGGQPQQEIGRGILRAAWVAGVEGEDPVVVERGVVNHFLQDDLAAQLDGMARGSQAEDVAALIEIAAGDRSWNGAVQVESAGDLDLR